jgi:hypothetical protein
LIYNNFQPGDPDLPFLIKPDNHDEDYQLLPPDQQSISFRDAIAPGLSPYEFRQSNFLDAMSIGAFDLSNSGSTQLVVKFSSDTRAVMGDSFVGIPLTEASDAAIKSLSDGPVKHGWLRFDGNGTPYKSIYTRFQAGRIGGVTYFLVWHYTNPLALLLKPAPDGSMSTACTFDRVGSDY